MLNLQQSREDWKKIRNLLYLLLFESHLSQDLVAEYRMNFREQHSPHSFQGLNESPGHSMIFYSLCYFVQVSE